jgi:hypothetical protein
MTNKAYEGLSNTELDNILKQANDFASQFGKKGIVAKVASRSLAQMADEIKIYKEANNVKEQQNVEKRRIQEKQIRQLRSNYRPGGGLMRASTASPAALGDSTGLPNKLGTA